MSQFLLIFAGGVNFANFEPYKNGSIILQDKASCLPPFVLCPTPGSVVVDACAAPGNKTTLAAALMGNRGRVVAFDLDSKRTELLKKMTGKAGVLRESDGRGCVMVRNEDFLATEPEKDDLLKSAEFLIVDPSCSGTGIHSRLNHLTDDADSSSAQRFARLQSFQLRALTHALSRFPRARRVVYSTCSVRAEENEIVVAKALARVDGWRLEDAMPAWKTRGSGGDESGPDDVMTRCLRATPEADRTNGFFVALFVRDSAEDVSVARTSVVNNSEYVISDDVSNDETHEEGAVSMSALSSKKRKKLRKKEKRKKQKILEGVVS